MKRIQFLFAAVTVILLSGCSFTPQKPVPLDSQFYQIKNEKVGIYLDALPKANTHFPGANCLLCLAAAEVANSDLSDHVQSLPNSDLNDSVTIVEGILKAKGLDVIRVENKIDIKKLESFSSESETIPYARKDYRSLKDSLGVDKLVIIDINQLGVQRSYNAYVPTSDPLGYAHGAISVIDLSDNRYNLYESFNIKTAVKGDWDEPNQFPGVTTAYFQSIEVLKEQIKTLFSI